MKKIYSFLLLIASITAQAQWHYANFPYGGQVLCLSHHGNTFFAGTAAGLFQSNTNGNNWYPVNDVSLYNILCLEINGGNVYAGTAEGIYKTSNDGLTWVKLGTKGIEKYRIHALAFMGSSIFAATVDGVFSSDDEGNTWILANNNFLNTKSVSGLYATGNNLFASTYLNLYRSTDKGKTWIQVDTGGTGNIVAFYFSKTKQTLLAAGPMGLFASSDNGLTWEKSSTFPSQYIHSATTRGDSILVGVDSGLFCSYNNGNTWELLNKGLRDSIVTCNMATEVGLFAGTRDGFYSFDAAIKTWGPKNDGLTNRGPITLNSIGSDLFAGTFEGAFLSRDSCKTWSDIHDIPFQAIVLDLAATPNNNLIACTSDKGMFFSKDKGNTWASKGNDLPEILWTVEQFNNRLYAGSEGKGLYTSTDEGENWTSVPTGFAFDFTIYAIASLGNNLFLGTDKGLLISYDKGTNWGLNADLMFAIFTICVNKNRIFVAGDGGAVYFSDDTATTWTAGKGLMANYIEDLDAKASTVFAASPSDGIFASTDNGETWNLIQDNIKNKQAYALAIQDEYIYLGIYGGGVWRRKISEITPGVREDADIPFFTVYPNPSNGILNIKTFMSMDHIELMNPLGQFYYLAPSTAYETQLDLSKHPKGIYIIRVISRNGKGSSRKIILQ